MKLITFVTCLYILTAFNHAAAGSEAQKDTLLIGEWKLDMTPNNPDDNNFAKMSINKIEKGRVYGEFYRDGVKMQNGVINRQANKTTVALVSSDNSGSYNSTFYLDGDMLYGSTHAIEREFVATWTATKQ
jgi:hypothetical protein